MKKSGVLMLIMFFVMQGITQNVTLETAAKVAFSFYRFYAPDAKKGAVIEGVREYKCQNNTGIYIFTFDQGGFVIVPSNNQADPVLGYGFEGKIPVNISNPTAKFWFDGYAEYVDSLNRNTTKSAKMNTKWEDILNNRFLKSAQEVTPLLTTKWNQTWPYNIKCPADASGSGGHTVTGCVATAMAQIMKYYNFPQKGFGTLGYDHTKYGNQSADFGATTYDWTNMPNTLSDASTDAQKNAVGTLMYHLGINVQMNYGTDGSTAQLGSLPFSMFEFFNYLQPMLIDFNMYPVTALPDILRKELDAGRPVYYAAGHSSTGARHALVCDGYQGTEYFHFNFGWGGTGDGYYYLNGASPAMSFVKNYEAITNLQPDNGQNVRANTTWEGNFTINSRVGVRSDATLTIKPGTTIKFGKDGAMIIYGNINARGTAGAPIVFTAQDTLVGWNGIELNNALSKAENHDSARFFNCEFSYSKASYTTATSMCGVHYWVTSALMVTKYSKLSIDSCKFIRNDGSGRGTAAYFYHSSPRLSNSLITKNRGTFNSAILMSADTWEITSPVIENNTISYNSSDSYGALVLETSVNPLIRSNKIISNTSTSGFAIFSYYDANPEIINNLIANNYHLPTGLNQGDAAVISYNNTTSNLINNTLANNAGVGILLRGSNTITMKNNIIWGQEQHVVRMYEGNTLNISYCDIQGGADAFFTWEPGTSVINYEHNISSYPGFLGAANYQLKDTSSCINNGAPDQSNLGLPAKDVAGNPRVFGGRIDIGAYENQTKVAPAGLFFNPEKVILYSTVAEPDSAVVKVNNINKVKITGLTGLASPFSSRLSKDSTLVVIKVNSATGGDFRDTLMVASSAGTKYLPVAAWAGKAVSGEVSGSWTAPLVRVEGDIHVPDGKTLQISPSTKVEFLGHYKLNVQGRLLAVGQSGKMITFTGIRPVGWKGIRFDTTPATNDTSKIQFCVLENGIVSGVNLERDGGALFADHISKLIVSDCIIRNNDATGYSGGGIALQDSCNAVIKNCRIMNNKAVNGGGISIHLNSRPRLIGNYITGNTANSGGGIYVSMNSKPFIVNNLLAGNSGAYGGAIRMTEGTQPILYNNTIVENTSDRGESAGLSIAYSSRALITNNIIYGNKIMDNGNIPATLIKYNQVYFSAEGDADFYNNDIQGGRDSMVVEGGYTLHGVYTDNLSVNPKLVTFGTETCYPANNSPCVNKGKADISLNDLGTAVDLMGYPRIYGGRIDIGAFESSGLVNVRETGIREEWVVYPNPSTGKFRILFPDALSWSGKDRVEVINILGECVLQVRKDGEKNFMEIDLSDQPKGMYLIRTNLKGGNSFKKVVIN